MSASEEFDYIVVGAGSAGCVLAARLTEDPGVRVLLLEAGGWDRDPLISIPLGVGRIWQKRRHDWGYDVEPEPGLGGRRLPCLRGKVIGGSSSINAMAYVRGHRSDYDRWAASGLKGWSYAQVLPYFRRQESWQGGATPYRGAEGPLATGFTTYEDPMVEAWFEAGRALGHPVIDDYNGERQEGFSLGQFSIRKGRRESAASAYLRPALGRPGLRVEVNALATRVLLGSGAACPATGIEYVQNGKISTARAAREVILSGGAINSPQLLMLSGIGDPEELARHGIQVRAALRGVGANLCDHLGPPVTSRRNGRGPIQRRLRMDRAPLMLGQAWLFGTGFAAAVPCGPMVFLKSDSSLPAPDVQLLINAVPMLASPYPPFSSGFPDEFTARPMLLRPQSRGRVRLAGADPARKAIIQQNFLAEAHDLQTLRTGIRMARDVLRQAPLAQYVASEVLPGKDKLSDADLDERIRATSTTANHPAGTCKMGLASDPLAVVDDELRVFGVERLRVVDASVMPDLVGGNINSPVIMIGERAADLLRGRPAPAPARLED